MGGQIAPKEEAFRVADFIVGIVYEAYRTDGVQLRVCLESVFVFWD